MDDVDQMLANEVRRMDRAIEARQKALDAVLAARPSRRLPKRFVLDFVFTAGDTQMQSRNFAIGRGIVRFECHALTHTLLAVGETELSTSSLATVPPSAVRTVMPFLWQVSETTRNRSWQDMWLPWPTLGPAVLQPRTLPAPAMLEPSANVRCDVLPLASQSVIEGTTFFSTASSYRLQVAFIGVEVLS